MRKMEASLMVTYGADGMIGCGLYIGSTPEG
jgi:hypothetical protein